MFYLSGFDEDVPFDYNDSIYCENYYKLAATLP
jgi:hypothetical protein